jgi:glucose/mannose-6-phosphate isomerase
MPRRLLTGIFPELNHNEIVGFEYPLEILNKIHVIILRDKRDHPRVQKRIEITKGIIKDVVDGFTEVWASGEGDLARLFSLIYTGDYASLYLAALYGIDPGPVKVIDYLKWELSSE